MKLASFVAGGVERFGIVANGGIIDLSKRVSAPDLRSALAAGPGALEEFAREAADWPLDTVRWRPPIPNPVHMIAVGLNTKSHFDETAVLMNRKPGDFPVHPRLFMRSPLSVVGHEEQLYIPRVSEQLDYEGEIAVVIGRAGRYISADRAMDHVAGYACFNEGSVRDFQTHSNQVTAGKNFAASGSFGPWMVTADEVPDPSKLTLQTRVNGEVRQRLVMSDLIFSFVDLIVYISKVYSLQVGMLEEVVGAGIPKESLNLGCCRIEMPLGIRPDPDRKINDC